MAQSLQAHACIAQAGEHYDRHVKGSLMRLCKRIQPLAIRQVQVQQDYRRLERGQKLQTGSALRITRCTFSFGWWSGFSLSR